MNYYTGKKENPHWFCRRCASVLGIDLTNLMATRGMENRYTINVSLLLATESSGLMIAQLRMLKDFDLGKLKTREEKRGRDMPPKYEV